MNNIKNKLSDALTELKSMGVNIMTVLLVKKDYDEFFTETQKMYFPQKVNDTSKGIKIESFNFVGIEVNIVEWKPEDYELDPSIPTISWMCEPLVMGRNLNEEPDRFGMYGISPLVELNIPRCFTLDPLAEIFPKGQAILKNEKYWAEEMEKCKSDPVYYYKKYVKYKLHDGSAVSPTDWQIKEYEHWVKENKIKH